MTTEPTPPPPLELPDRASWRTWLEAHHADSDGVWLAIGRKGNAVTRLTYDDAVEEALCFGWIDSVVNRLDDDRFRQRFTPRRRGGTWARSNKERVERLIAEGLMTPAGLAVIEAARADGSWTLLENAENRVVPDDLAHALSAAGFRSGFAQLPQSRQTQLLYWIATAKRAETRARRIAATVTEAGGGPQAR